MDTTKSSKTTIERSIEALRAGKPQEAVNIAKAAVDEAVRAHGKDSPEEARALFDMANVFVFLGNLEMALDWVTKASVIAVKDNPAKGAQLDYIKARGELLQKLGRMEQAKAAYEQSVEGRKALYGEESLGVARGELPLADLCLQMGDLERAEALVERVAGQFWHAQDEMLPASLALRAFILAARYGDEKPMFEHFDMLPAPKRAQLIMATLQIAQNVPPEAAFTTLQELRERLEDFQSPDLRQDALPFAQELSAVVELQHAVARAQKNLERVGETLTWLAKHYESQHALPQLLTVQMRQAHLKAAQGDAEGAAAGFAAVADRLDALDATPLEIAMPLRCELAGFFASKKNEAKAGELFRKACEQAEKTKDPRHIVSTCSAYGYFLQHSGRGAEAFDWLQRAYDATKGEGFAALELRLHLNAIVNGAPCGCTDKRDALTQELDRRIRSQLPEGLLDAVRINPAKGIELSLKRPPTEEEQEKLKTAIPTAIEQIKALNITRPTA